MQLLHRALYAGFLILCFAPSLEAAIPLRQPASILPWQAAQVQAKQANPKLPTQESDSPVWLLESAKPLPKTSSSQPALPMVETDHYVEIGQLRAGSSETHSPRFHSATTPRPRTQRWFDIFRWTPKK